MHHRPGHSMGKSDALSRRADHGTGAGDNSNVTLLRPEFFATHAIRALSGLSLEGEERDILQDIRKGNREGKQEDAVVKSTTELRRSKGNSVRASEWSEHNGLLCFRDRIYVPNDPELRRRITSQHHDTRVAGHPGRWKTLELVSHNYWWLGISHYVASYVAGCDVCNHCKSFPTQKVGKLTPNRIPTCHWEVISVDTIRELLESKGYNAILVAVDRLSKHIHAMTTITTVDSTGVAHLFLEHVWRHHGLLEAVISDRGSAFISNFSRELATLLDI